jgi:putative sigma-54 modulation protein
MIVEFTGRNVDVTPKLRTLADSRTARLERHLGGTVNVRVILAHEKHRFRAEILATPTQGRGRWNANEETSDPRAALVQAFEKINAQATRQSAKRRDRKHAAPLSRPARAARAVESRAQERVKKSSPRSEAPSRARVVRVGRRSSSAKPMTVEEAAMRIDGSREDFLVFRDSGSEKISVLYKRRDGDLGLVVPE